MRKIFAALALATLTILAVPAAASADDSYLPVAPSTTPSAVACDGDPASPSSLSDGSSSASAAAGSTASSTSGTASRCVTDPATTGQLAALPTTGMSAAVLPIAVVGGLLALLGVVLLVSRRLARR